MIMTPIYQEWYFVYESLETKVDKNSMMTSREIGNGMSVFEQWWFLSDIYRKSDILNPGNR